MKFSWKLINQFIDLNEMTLDHFKNHLTLSGLEVDNIDNIENDKDKVIDLSITTNRDEIYSAFSLAREASTIFNIPIKILPIRLNYYNSVEYDLKKLVNHKYTHIEYTRIIHLGAIDNKKTPKWLSSELKIYQIKETSILNNIQEYIKMKWGKTFYILTLQEIKERKNLKQHHYFSQLCDLQEITKLLNNTADQLSNSKLLIFTTTQARKDYVYLTHETNEFCENIYNDSIKLINTIIHVRIGKYIERHRKIVVKDKSIKVKRDSIHKCLGQVIGKTYKFIDTNKTIEILKQLKLRPEYNKEEKVFKVYIPDYRKNDLTREIDLIEEIGRIYQFNYFFNQIKKDKLKGYQSKNSIKIKKIRSALRNLGLHEVVNCGITNNLKRNNESIKIYNSITNERKELRLNILESIINNYQHNRKHSANNIEIFEVGKVFKRDNKNKKEYIEQRHIGGLIYNIQYNRNNWQEKPNSINFFHFKNVMETFLIKINSTATLKKIVNNKDIRAIDNVKYLLKKNTKMHICNQNNQTVIGIIGELNDRVIGKSQIKHERVYIFEINLDDLLETAYLKNHLNYSTKKYSYYPSVIRDVSVTLAKHVDIEQIKQIILQETNELIESVEVFNEYKKNDKIPIRVVSLRVKYRSFSKTLSSTDIKKIDLSLEHKLKIIEQV
uniref:phenylalanine--tRNA ligase n=1 Tax=Pleurostichidium falkenbergii TaxID=121064 RepID=A0A4D6UYN6_9FLOR|nr:Phenylalanine-tRNA ligase beta subunit [Pleurostichidium falkenbergii]QCH39748.1 Phenylalanine-tRNA ligase beta subunit [Pleurostichidium falkenbergii]